MPTRREKERKQIRYTDAKKVAEQQGSGFTPTAFTVPEGMSLFRFKQAKTYNLDVIPYRVGKGNPRADEGMVHFERTYYVHQKIGPNNDSIPCLTKNWKKKCPICQYRAKLGMDPKAKKDVLKALEPKVRQLWIIRDRDELEKGLQLFDAAYYKSWGELVKAKTKAGDEKYRYHHFFHLDDGMMLRVTAEEDSYEGRKFFKPTNIEMRDRKPLKASLLDKAPCLDDLLVEKSYKELKELFLQISDEDEEDDDEVEDGSELEDDEDSDEVEDGSEIEDPDEEEDEKPTKSKKGPTKSKKAEEDDEEEDDESESDDDDEEDPKPAKKSGKGSKKTSKKDEEDEEDSDSDDDDDTDEDSDDEDEEESEDDEEGDDSGPTFAKGDRVKGVYKSKGFKGKVTIVQKRKGKEDLITVETDGGNKRVMDADELTLLSKAKKKETDDDEGEDEEETPSKSSKTSSKKASKTTKKTSKKKEEEDDDDDIPFDDEGEEDDD